MFFNDNSRQAGREPRCGDADGQIFASCAAYAVVMAIGTALGVGLGAVLGIAVFNDIGIGVAFGIAIGAACGYFLSSGK